MVQQRWATWLDQASPWEYRLNMVRSGKSMEILAQYRSLGAEMSAKLIVPRWIGEELHNMLVCFY